MRALLRVTVRVIGLIMLVSGISLGIRAIGLPWLQNPYIAVLSAVSSLLGILLIHLSLGKELSTEQDDEVGRQHPLPRAGGEEDEDEEHLRKFTMILDWIDSHPDRKG